MSHMNEHSNDTSPFANEFAGEDNISDKNDISTVELSYLVNSILEYYHDEDAGDGDQWKKESGMSNKNIPEDIDVEVKKAFISQLRKFQDE